MNVSLYRLLLFTVLFFPLVLSVSTAQAESPKNVTIVVPQNAASPVKSGADNLRDGLTRKGLQAQIRSEKASSDIQIVLSTAGDAGNKNAEKAPPKPESYAISISPDKKTLYVNGSDATGTMYGALDLAEQIGAQPGPDFAGSVKAVSKSPYLEMRGVNMFLTVQDIDNADGAFWADDYWKIYLDTMARNRYNLLDIHGPCDPVTLTFPNGFAFFVSLPDFPEVGVGPERAAKNLARFKQVVQMAADRGIHVAYMNYEATPSIGPWKTRRFGVDERWVDLPDPRLDGPRLETYTREAVSSFLKQVPQLWMFGFRIGESGQPEDFYKKTYLVALAELPPTLKIYLRTWIADPEKVRELAASTKNPVYIEPKYNGEQLGSPYQASLGGRQYPPSGSYENYTDKPQKYSILWQIRAHGTNRVFYWASPDFARRTVRSCKFGDGVGFSMEPMEAYLPAADYLHNNPKTDHHFYKWEVEREWAWHLIWGRTAYDPEVPDQVFINEFVRRFGAQAGPLVFQALAESSKIVPFVYSYHNVGMDHQDFAPEFENGDHAFGARARLWQGTRLAPYGGNNSDFLRVNTLDRTAMASPSVYVDERLKGITTGKISPYEAAGYLDQAAENSEKQIEAAARLNPDSAKNFDCIKMDIEAVAWLGRYYRDRIISATNFAFFESTTDHASLTQAYEYLTRAINDWDHLSDITERHFGYVPEYIRMGVKDFRWRDEGRSLGVDLDQINNLETALAHPSERDKWLVSLGHVPPVKIEPGKPFTATITAATSNYARRNPHVYMFYRNSRQSGFKRLNLTSLDETEKVWSGVIPADQVVPGYLEYYFGADSGRWGLYDESIAHRSPYRVQVNTNDAKPVISFTAPSSPVTGELVNFTAKVSAKAKIKMVTVYYKLLPAYYEWLKVEMQPSGDGNFTAAVPLTPEGILYYFEAVDEDGNGANYPNVLQETPYLVIDSWEPQVAGR